MRVVGAFCGMESGIGSMKNDVQEVLHTGCTVRSCKNPRCESPFGVNLVSAGTIKRAIDLPKVQNTLHLHRRQNLRAKCIRY